MPQTTIQKRLAAIRAFFKENHRMPSYAEMTGLFRVQSKNAVAKIVAALCEQGLLKKDKTGRLLPHRLTSARILGTVEAGFPSPAEEEMADTMSLDDYLIHNHDASFLLKVSGDSMINAGIHQGDLVIVERGRTPKSGDIVVAEIDHEWTMKYYEKRGGKIVLIAANPRYPPFVPKEELAITGVVTGVVRKYI
ncbi:repressor LexA [Candidatus Uhrbacteria bacterium]|nr:repressor LexA [Candidatus Uhrbacteria bacterium]